MNKKRRIMALVLSLLLALGWALPVIAGDDPIYLGRRPGFGGPGSDAIYPSTACQPDH